MPEFAILTVCSGNICRSPLAEQLLRAGLSDWADLTVSSAGTIAMEGDKMPDEAAALSVRYGGSPSAHAARQLIEAQIRQADLVLGMSRDHRRAVVQLLPSASRYTFTLREFARLVVGATDDDFHEIAQLTPTDVGRRWTEAVDIAASNRCLQPRPPTAASNRLNCPRTTM